MSSDANRKDYEASIRKWAQGYKMEDGRMIAELRHVELLEVLKDFIERQEHARRRFP